MTAVEVVGALPPLVGRDAELSVVRGLVSAVAAGQGGALLVTGSTEPELTVARVLAATAI